METGHDEPKAFDIILLLLFGGRSVVAGNKPVTFASEIGYPNENQDYCEKDESPNHTNFDLQKQRYTKYQTSHHTHTIEKAGSSTSLLSPFPIIEI